MTVPVETMTNAKDAALIFLSLCKELDREECFVLATDTKGHFLGAHKVGMGSVHTLPVALTNIFKFLLTKNAEAFVLCHNHVYGMCNLHQKISH